MNSPSKYLKAFYHSLVFWPLGITLLFLVAALSILDIDEAFALGKYVPSFTIVSEEAATTLLGAILGGLITLVVFSFTMMMTLFNQASSHYSPRLVTSFIARRSYQLILGYYVGSIVYVIIVIFNVGSYSERTPELSVLFAVLFGVTSFGVFVYFLNSVSQSMLVTNLLKTEYINGCETINRLPDWCKNRVDHYPHEFVSYKAGYEYDIDLDQAQNFASANDISLQILAPGLSYSHASPVLAYTTKKLTLQQESELLDAFSFYTPPQSSLSFETNMRRIEEVGVKAMSPSTNDPGTAVLVLDYLTELSILRSEKQPNFLYTKDSTASVYLLHVEFSDLVTTLFSHLYFYAKNDPEVKNKLLCSIQHIERFGNQSVVQTIAGLRTSLQAESGEE